MDTIDIIKNRRSIRKYGSKGISNQILNILIDAARHAPYGGPLIDEGQLWEFIIIRDNYIKKELAHNNKEREWIIEVPVIIAFCLNPSKDPKYRNFDFVTGLAVENFLIAAQSLGLGTCIVDCYPNHIAHAEDRKIMRKALKLPDNIRLVHLVTLGYPNEIPEKKPLKEIKDIIYRNVYKSQYEE